MMSQREFAYFYLDVIVEYILRTGRTFPSMNLVKDLGIDFTLVSFADGDNPPNPVEVVNFLISEKLLES